MKTITTIALILLILLMTVYAIFYYAFNLSKPSNSINQNYRDTIIKHPFLRNILRLHQVGDYRYDYLDNTSFKALEIIVYQKNTNQLKKESVDTVISEISSLVKQPKTITLRYETLPENTNSIVDDNAINALIKSYSLPHNNQAYLEIFVLDEYTEIPTYAGIVENGYSLFLFSNPIKKVSGIRGTSPVEISTILHEFGHLLGAGHIEKDNCIMSEKVENLTFGRPTLFTTTYCPEDIQAINKPTVAK